MDYIIPNVGDFIDVNKLLRELKELYPNVDFEYVNVYSDSVGYIDKVYGDGEVLMVVECKSGDRMIRDKKTEAINKVLGGD